MVLQSSQGLPELLFYTKKSYRILQLQLQFQLQFYKGTHPPYTIHTTYKLHLHVHIQRILHPEIQFYIQKTKSSSSTTTTHKGQRDVHSRFQKRNSTHRRQGDLLEMHPCVLQDFPMTFQAFQPQDLPRHSSCSRDIPDIPVIHDLPASPGNSTSSSISRDSTPFQHSPIRMHILQFLQILQFDWFPQKTPPSTSWAITVTNITNIHSSKKGRCCDIG